MFAKNTGFKQISTKSVLACTPGSTQQWQHVHLGSFYNHYEYNNEISTKTIKLKHGF